MTIGYYCAIFPFCGGGKIKDKKTKVFYDWATTGIPVKILSTRSPKLRLLCRLSKSLVFGWYQTEGVLILFHTRILEKFTLHVYKGKTSNLPSCVQGFWKNLRFPRNER